MGCRRDVVLCLLRARAPLLQRSNEGQTPLDMCRDNWTREAIQSFISHRRKSPDKPWRYEKEDEVREDSHPSKMQYEPFFVPRSSVITEDSYKQEFLTLGTQIFNRQPGEGLAFLVASGATRDYPHEMSAFLRKGRPDHVQIGNFLGESFSLSQTPT